MIGRFGNMVLAVLALGFAVEVKAQTVLAQNNAASVLQNGSAPGQSFLVLGSGPYTDITFNFIDNATGLPAAPGQLSIYTAAYTGSPSALSSFTTGLVGRSTSNAGGIYAFDPAMTLTAGNTYYAYATIGSTLRRSDEAYAGGQFYSSAGDAAFAANAARDWVFTVSGTAAAPEPAGWAMMIGGFALIGYAVRARRRQVPARG